MIQPLGARAVIKRLPRPQLTSEFIEVVAGEEKPSNLALVLAVGKLKQGGFDVGDIVYLTDYCGAACVVELDGEQIDAFVVPEEDVLAKVEGV